MDRDGSGAARLGSGLTGDLFPVTAVDEPRRTRLAGREIPYRLKRSQRRRRIAFLVDENGLTVHTPWRVADAAIDHALASAADWILRKLDEWSARPRTPRRQWIDGEPVDYLGRALQLEVVHDPLVALTEIDERVLRVRTPKPDDAEAIRALVVKWYRRHAERHFPERIDHFVARLGVERPRIFLSDAVGRWGSCNAKREVRLNWRLMQAPTHVVDYVVAHELAHLVHLNHSARFWRTVERIFPDYEAARAELAGSSRHFMSL
jgi:predicted metal-dependent hydrolase